MHLSLRPGAEPFYLHGGPTGVLLLHGFTGATRDVRPIAEALHADGLTAHGVRLAQHGAHGPDLNRAHWRDWYASALDGYHLLRQNCERVFVVGLSMGGMLALRLAAERPAVELPVAGVVTLSMPTYLYYQRAGWRARFAGLYGSLFPFVVKENPSSVDYSAGYPVFPTLAVQQFFNLMKETDALLPRITAPVLLVHSRADDFIPPENMPYVHSRLTGAPRAMFWLERSEHVVTRSNEMDGLLARLREFIRNPLAVSDVPA
jgi:carboxylesterase